jgi:hypothetical protein
VIRDGQYLSHAQSELALGDRLLQQVDALVETALMNHCISRIACHVEHFERRTELLRPSAQLAPIDARHDNIGQQEVNHRLILQKHSECGLRAGRRQHAIVEITQYIRDVGPKFGVVFDHQDGFRLALDDRFIRIILLSVSGAVISRELHSD